jgi:hypothetical protein
VRPLVNRLLRKICTKIVADYSEQPAMQWYFRARRRINELLDYELAGRRTRCRIGKIHSVHPRQLAVVGPFELILQQMRRVARPIRA